MKLTDFIMRLGELTPAPRPGGRVSVTEDLLKLGFRPLSLRSDPAVVGFGTEDVVNDLLLHLPEVELGGEIHQTDGEYRVVPRGPHFTLPSSQLSCLCVAASVSLILLLELELGGNFCEYLKYCRQRRRDEDWSYVKIKHYSALKVLC